MLSRLSLKKKLFIGIAMVVTIILASGALVQRMIGTVSDGWNYYQTEVATRKALIDDFRSDIGYGALIHNYKDYILHGQPAAKKRAIQNYDDFDKHLNQYLSLQTITDEERKAINELKATANQFRVAIDEVTKLHANGMSAVDIDLRVAIDGTSAANAFEYIQSYYNTILDGADDQITDQLLQATTWIVLGLSLSTLIIVFAMYHTYTSVIPPLKHLNATMRDIAEGEGDLRARLDDSANNELGSLAHAFNLFISRIESIIQKEKDMVDELMQSSKQLNDIAIHSNKSIEIQKSNTEQLSAALEEVSATVSEVAGSTMHASEAATNIASLSKQGAQSVIDTKEQIASISTHIDNAASVIGEVNSASDSIGEMLNVISDIADQTNLLALNAAIEAARAGESGRGFAVVADEVRGLAQRTGDSLDEIQKTIDRLQSGVSSAVEAMERGVSEAKQGTEIANSASESINEIVDAITATEAMNLQISTAAEQQKVVIEEMNSNVHQISDMSSAVFDGSADIVDQAQGLSNTTDDLSRLVGSFKTA